MTIDEEVYNIKQKQMNRVLFLIMPNSLSYSTAFGQNSEIIKTGSIKNKGHKSDIGKREDLVKFQSVLIKQQK